MASDNLTFEFSRRWREIGARLFPSPTPDQEDGISMLEQNMRDLEDAWPAESTGSGTSQSLLGTVTGTAGFDLTGGTTHTLTTSYTVPSDAAFTYYAEVSIHAVIHKKTGDASPHIETQGIFSFTEFTTGAGYENYGFIVSSGAWSAATVHHYQTGHGYRMVEIPPDVLGDTIHLVYDLTNQPAGSDGSLANIDGVMNSTMNIFAIPI